MSLVHTLSISNCGILGIVHAASDQLLRSELESSLSLARLPFLVFYQLTKMVMRKAPDMAIKFPTSPFANLCNILMLSVWSACSSWRLQHPLESSSYIHDHTPTYSALVQLHSILSMTIPMTATFSLCSPTKLDSCKSDNIVEPLENWFRLSLAAL